NEQVMSLPLTIADWAATESRFKKHFAVLPDTVDEDVLVPFHAYLDLPAEEREGKTPFIYGLDAERRLARAGMGHEIVELAEDRLKLWHMLRQMAGLEVAPAVRDLVEGELESEYEARLETLKGQYEQQLAELKVRYPQVVARRLAEGLLRADRNRTVADLLAEAEAAPMAPGFVPSGNGGGNGAGGTAVAEPVAPPKAAAPAAPPAPAPAEAGGELELEPWIESARCTSCDECTGINRKLFAYNDKKQAYIKDPKAGTFKDLVVAAERCPVGIIHPGTPLNPKEKGLEKLIARAARFN
ncbi:MAG: ferredoxin, partial [Gemmatimonadota bacterium]|nr:ferredoxin [Gemmatimonadota bacterium]